MKRGPLEKCCPACGARLRRRDFVTQWPARARLVFALATVLTLVWAPVFLMVAGAPMIDLMVAGLPMLGGVTRGGFVILAAIAIGPGLAVASFAGRQQRLARCRDCGWFGAVGEAKATA